MGDRLSIERMVNAQKARARGATPARRLEGLVPSTQEFHKEGILMQVLTVINITDGPAWLNDHKCTQSIQKIILAVISQCSFGLRSRHNVKDINFSSLLEQIFISKQLFFWGGGTQIMITCGNISQQGLLAAGKFLFCHNYYYFQFVFETHRVSLTLCSNQTKLPIGEHCITPKSFLAITLCRRR